MMARNFNTRFERQLALPGMNSDKQEQLLQAKVIVVGVGGLGCAVLESLLRAGVQFITVFDGDVVALSNLHRQHLYGIHDVGLNKATQAVASLQSKLEAPHITAIPKFLDETLAIENFSEADLIMDCTDQFEARIVIDKVCKQFHKTWIYASVHGYETQLAVFRPHEPGWQHIFSGNNTLGNNCNNQGVWGMIPNALGYCQALEAVKYLCQLPEQLQGELIHFNYANYQQYAIRYAPKTDFVKIFTSEQNTFPENLSANEVNRLIQMKSCRIIDVRQFDETLESPWPSERIPMNILFNEVKSWSPSTPIIFICHSGYRSRIALDTLKDDFHFEEVYHLKGGLIQVKDVS